MRIPALLLLFCGLFIAGAAGAAEIRVLTVNVQTDASGGRLPGILELIRRSGADIVGLQEWTQTTSPDAKGTLGFSYRKLDDDTAILSRFPIEPSNYPATGARVVLPDGRKLMVADVHLFHKPYQPYQLLGIPYEGGRFIKTAEEAIDEARKARGKDVEHALEDLAKITEPVVLVGDFNEPSYLDWTQAAADAWRSRHPIAELKVASAGDLRDAYAWSVVESQRHPIKVVWPATKAFADAGFRDAYRTIYPDEMRNPGLTWTPTTRPDDPKDHHDRIDFVLYRGAALKVRDAQIVGESFDTSNIVVSPYPTDHRAVVASFEY